MKECLYFIIVGGCGAMFEINVIAPEFKGLNTIKQHRLINDVRNIIEKILLQPLNFFLLQLFPQALKEEIKDMHGVRIYTSVPEA